MKQLLKNRVLPVICAVSILLSLCMVSASASFPDEFRDRDAVADWEAILLTNAAASINVLMGIVGGASAQEIFWTLVNRQLGNRLEEVSRADLEIMAAAFNGYFTGTLAETFPGQFVSGTNEVASNILAKCLIGNWEPYFTVEYDSNATGFYRIYENTTGLFVVNSAGAYPYCDPSVNDGLGSDQWVPLSYMDKGSFRMLNPEALYNLADDVGGSVFSYGNYYCIAKSASSGVVGKLVLANEDGKPYVCWKDKNQSATSQDRPQTEVKNENGEVVEDMLEGLIPGINLDNMTVTLPDGSINFIDNLIYDESTRSYTIDSHDTYNTENNYYLEWNYSWTYYINFTSITYIGQTEEYDKYYEVYYELPDGRNSADLSKEDLEQLNLSIDVMPYGRSADDTSLRSLYHFDGDTKDASYWNYCTDFTWNQGASLTYMEAGTFEGALYLDETTHDFTLLLPSALRTEDFTLQFRYYQSHTLTPATDSYIDFGGTQLFKFTGGDFLSGSGATLTGTPVGTWNEIALIRDSGTVYYYLNGVCIGGEVNTSFLSDKITFHFGTGQQTYKYFDELRVLNYALQTSGANYTPTAVPHDTNLSLVLPDSAVPVADEYWSITSSGENLFDYDIASGTAPGFVGVNSTQTVGTYYSSTNHNLHSEYALADTSTAFAYPSWGLNQHLSSAVYSEGFMTLTTTRDYTFDQYYYSESGTLYEGKQHWLGSALSTMISFAPSEYGSVSRSQFMQDGDYILSVALGDGTVCSYPFTVSGGTVASTSQTFGSLTIGTQRIASYMSSRYSWLKNVGYYLYILPANGVPVDIRYIELIKGTETDLKAEFVSSIVPIDKDSLHTPTLAVRTDEEITSHIIGGPRPSLPEKGMVWALVENERITSIQIYNGQAWEPCDGRIWTGERWVPASAYNVITLQDMYDIADATPDFEYIYSESGFWTWWQKSWNAFTERLFKALESGGSGGSGASGGEGSSELKDIDLDAADSVADPDQEDSKSMWQFIVLVVSGGKSVVSGTREMFSGVVSTVPDTMDTITSAFDPGGLAVGVLDGTTSDPDAADMPSGYSESVPEESEVLDPWRYR